ncbi:uncharacterized protein LOC115514555 isoform X3 [Lynx canadensis]|uniref:uncharacterized protein LOC115514555 isoform X3 n=1 Tax=Lynx canadensis TaxID=61383 RepID=UPI0011B039D6|nr:uncharacterized protein LOC115514555 isoform X3 [Lynx canadensis]
MVDWRMANETEKRDGAVYLSECVNGCLRVVSMSSTHGAGLARYPDPKLFIRDQHPESQVSSSREKAEEAGSFFNPQLASEDSAGCISAIDPPGDRLNTKRILFMWLAPGFVSKGH